MFRAPSLLSLGVAAITACASAPVARTATPASVPTMATLASDDRIRIAEAFRLGEAIGDSIWPGWTSAPFAVLLVTPEREFLVRHPRPSPDFTRVGYDSLLGSEVLVRERTLSPALLATFPAVGGVSTIVVGQPRATGKSSTDWVLTLLHEHFHQLQQSRPDYFARVEALGLARGDRTGMWMLNYAFPYDAAEVQERFAAFSRAAAAAGDGENDGAPARLTALVAARDRLRAVLAPDDYRYLSFHLWQEGVARYTEYAIARLAAARYAPSPAFRALPDYQPFDEAARTLRERIVTGAREPKLGSAKRVALYPAGAAVALLLDEAEPGWRERYFERMFSLDELMR